MVCSKHPVSAAMFMIISLVGVAALFVLLEAFFLAVSQILVYAGAVMVLFLFIIMLLDVGPDAGKASKMKLVSGLAAAFSISLLISNEIGSFESSNEGKLPGKLEYISSLTIAP